MSYALDFAKIKAEHSIESVASRLGLKLKPHGQAFRCQCPSGEGDERGMAITPAKQAFYSFPAQKGGDCISLVAFVRGCSPKEAAAWIQGQATQPEKSAQAERPSQGFQPLDYLQHDHDAVIALGFDPDDAKRLGIGFAPRGVLKGTVALPVRTEDGKLSGYVGVTDAKLPPRWN